jgi:hypothetical protein
MTPMDLEMSYFGPSMTMPDLELLFPLNAAEQGANLEHRCIFLPATYDPDNPVAFTAIQHRLTPGEFRDALVGVSSILDISTDWFTYHFTHGAFGAKGLENFFSNLEVISVVPDHFDGNPANAKRIIYAAECSRDDWMLLDVKMGSVDGEVERVALYFLTDGTTGEDQLYRALPAQFGVRDVQEVAPTVQCITVNPEGPLKLRVDDRLVSKRNSDSEPVVSGLELENPLRDSDFSQVVEEEAESQVDAELVDNLWSGPRSYRAAYARVATPHPRGEYHTYQLKELTLQRISGLIEGEDIWNIDIEAEVLDSR